jgi:hypothetical protein
MRGYIYQIRSPHTELVYIGSTTQRIRQRFATHVSDWRKYGDVASKVGSMSYKVLEHGDGYIEMIEEREFNNRDEMIDLEKRYILEGGDNIVNKSSRVQTKYYNRERRREYYRANQPERCQYQQEYRERIRDIFA